MMKIIRIAKPSRQSLGGVSVAPSEAGTAADTSGRQEAWIEQALNMVSSDLLFAAGDVSGKESAAEA